MVNYPELFHSPNRVTVREDPTRHLVLVYFESLIIEVPVNLFLRGGVYRLFPPNYPTVKEWRQGSPPNPEDICAPDSIDEVLWKKNKDKVVITDSNKKGKEDRKIRRELCSENLWK